MKYLILALGIVSFQALGTSEISDKTPVQSLKIGSEILLEMPLHVRAASSWERGLLLESSKVTFQNGHLVEQTNSDSMFCELKIEGSFTNDEILEPRTLVLLSTAEMASHKGLRTKSIIWKLHNTVVSELKCMYPTSKTEVITVGDIKKVFEGDQKLKFRTSSEEIE